MDTNTATAPQPGLFINRDFALLWSGRAISTLGDYIFDTTLILWIATVIGRGQSWAPLAVSGVLLATALPTLLIGPIAGVFVDRWQKRPTMLWMDALRAILIAVLMLVSGLLPLPFVAGGRLSAAWQLGAIYGVVFLSTTCAQFFSPAGLALLGDIVPEPQRARASGLLQMQMSLAIIIGPPLAAPLLFGLGVQWALLLNALSFAASFVALLALRAPRSAMSVAPGQPGNLRREMGEGLRFFAGNRVLMTILISAVVVMLGGGALNALDIFFVTQNLHTQPGLYGLLGAAMGVGALVGAILASIFAQRLGVARLFWLSILGLGLCIMVYARLTSFAPAAAVLLIAGLPQAAVNVAVAPLLLQVTPRDLIGRVSAVLMPLISLASMLSIVVAGYLDSTLLHRFHARLLGLAFGPVDTIFSATGLLAVLGGLYAWANLRGVTMGAPATSEPAPPAEQPVEIPA